MKPLSIIHYLLLGLFILFTASLYIYNLDKNPSGLYVDEASQGYNAYSILLTGKDEYGQPFPIAFRLFGAYTPPLYTYLLVPLIKLLGLNVFSVRLLSAISGIFSVTLIYLLIRSFRPIFTKWSALIGALLFAISPWELMFARSGYEANLGLFTFILAVYLVWKGLKNRFLLILGIIILSLSTYSSFTIKFISPLFLASFLILFKNQFNKKALLIGLLIGLLLQIPNLYLLTTPAFFAKNHLFYSKLIESNISGFNVVPTFIGLPTVFLYEFFSLYLAYFSPRVLFLIGDQDLQRSIPTLSVFYPWMVIPYLFGLYYLWKLKSQPVIKLIILLAILSPIPASLVGDPFSSYRALPLILPMILIMVLGIQRLLIKHQRFSLAVLAFFTVTSLISLWRGYFIFLPNERAAAWKYGYVQLAGYIIAHPNDKFLINLSSDGPIYSELLFYLKYDPRLIQPVTVTNYYAAPAFNQDRKLSNVEIRNIDFISDIYTDQIIITDAASFQDQSVTEHQLTKVFEVKDPLGHLRLHGFKTNPSKKCQIYFQLRTSSRVDKIEQCDKLNDKKTT